MAEHDRHLHRPVAARWMQIAVADAGGFHFDQHFARAGAVELGGLDRQRPSLFPQNRSINSHEVFVRLILPRIMPATSRITASLAIAFAVAAVHAQNAGIEGHIAAAKAAAKTDHAVLFTSLCSAEPTGPGTGRRGAGAGQPGGAPPGPPAHDTWHAEPMKVFDNLYF